MQRKIVYLATLLCIFLTSSCAPGYYPNDPYGGGYNDPYYNNSYEHDRARDNRRKERELREERERLDRERYHLEQQREHLSNRIPPGPPHQYGAPQHQQQQLQTQCPSGYTQSERKCTSEERRHGCKDIRLNSGIGCVRR